MPQTYGEKVDWLLRYCAQYTSHDHMFDERIEDINQFNVDLGIEKQILSILEGKRIILLTGDAGDGKTRVLSNLQGKLDEAWEITNDFSELTVDLQKEKLQQLRNALRPDQFDGKRFAVAANTGILLNSISRYEPGLEKELQQNKELCVVLDFSKRNLAMQQSDSCEDIFEKIFCEFFSLQQLESCDSCILSGSCIFTNNIQTVNTKTVRDGVKLLYHSLYLMGIHVTFRDLLSSLAYLVTGGIDCKQLKAQNRSADASLEYYNNWFEYNQINSVLNAFSKLDMAQKDVSIFDMEYYIRAQNQNCNQEDILVELGRFKRKLYFENPQELLKHIPKGTRYDLLAADFLNQYNELLTRLKANNMLDSIDDIDQILQRLEMGLNKISDPYCTNSQMVLYDSPPLTPKNIQLVYTVERNIRLLFCTPEFFFSNGQPQNDRLNISEDIYEFICIVFDETKFVNKRLSEFPRLRIDYWLFKEVLFASHNIFRQTNAKLSENAHILSYTKQIFNMMTEVEKFDIVWVDAQKNSSRLQVSVIKPNSFSRDKRIKFQIS